MNNIKIAVNAIKISNCCYKKYQKRVVLNFIMKVKKDSSEMLSFRINFVNLEIY